MVVMMEEVQEVQEVEEGHPIWTMEEVRLQEQQQKLQHDEVRTMHS
jgi:transposase